MATLTGAKPQGQKSSPRMERKYVSLAQFKAVEEGAGGFKGYINKFSELDDVGDIILPGAYLDTIDQFLKRGFTADSHDWSFGGGLIGYPISLVEDQVGPLAEARFHSTADAQAVRTKAQERMDAGLECFISIGYELSARPIFISPKDYQAELPKYVSQGSLQDVLQKADSFSRVRIIPKLHLYEFSLVTVPALQSAMVTGLKSKVTTGAKRMSKKSLDLKGIFEEALDKRTNNLWTLWDVLCTVLYRLDDMEDTADYVGVPFDVAPLLDEALAEFDARIRAFVLADDEDQEESIYGYDYLSQGVSAADVKKRLGIGLQFTSQLQAVGYAVKRALERAERKIAQRKLEAEQGEGKEGRVLSSANWTEIDEIITEYSGLLDRLTTLRDSAKPKSESATDTEESDDTEKARSPQGPPEITIDRKALFDLAQAELAMLLLVA